jgi:hypothetical protein
MENGFLYVENRLILILCDVWKKKNSLGMLKIICFSAYPGRAGSGAATLAELYGVIDSNRIVFADIAAND